MTKPGTEPPRYVLILGTLFLLAYAAYHLGLAWSDAAISTDLETPVFTNPTVVRMSTRTPSTAVPATDAATAYPVGTATPPATSGPEAEPPSPTPDAYPGSTDSPPEASITPSPENLPTCTLLPTATPAQTDNPYPGSGENPTATPGTAYPDSPSATPSPTPTPGTAYPDSPSATPSPTSAAADTPTPSPTAVDSPIITDLPYDEIVIVTAGTIHQVISSQNGDWLAFASDNGAYIYDAETRQNQRILDQGDALLSLCFAAGDTLLVTGGRDGQIRWWEVDTGIYLGALDGHLLGVTGLDLPDSGSPLVSGGDDASLRVWDVANVEDDGVDSISLVHTWRDPVARIVGVDVSSNGHFAAAASRGYVHIWDLQDGGLLHHSQMPDWYTALAFSPNDRRLVTAYPGRGLDFWDTATWERAQFIYLAAPIRALAYSPNGLQLALGYEDGRIQIWEVGTETLRVDLAGHPGLTSLIFSTGGEALITTGENSTVRFWDLGG